MSISPDQRKTLSRAISLIRLPHTSTHGSQELRITCIKEADGAYKFKEKIVEREWREVISETTRTISKQTVHDYIHDNSDKFTGKYANWMPPGNNQAKTRTG